ncbi:MAG: NUDIX domain-containing protein [Sporocytophaga sp.]|nr:NUDIX domain-containing protein [Sporocytophaga sp.]
MLKVDYKFFTYKVASFIWKIVKPKSFGARAMLINGDEILLVKHTYQTKWYLPGGGLKTEETYEEAIRRELKEELNAEVYKLELFGVYNNMYEGKNDSITIFLCKDFELSHKKPNSEISDFKFFTLNDLPHDISPGTMKRINEYKNNAYPAFGRW